MYKQLFRALLRGEPFISCDPKNRHDKVIKSTAIVIMILAIIKIVIIIYRVRMG